MRRWQQQQGRRTRRRLGVIIIGGRQPIRRNTAVVESEIQEIFQENLEHE